MFSRRSCRERTGWLSTRLRAHFHPVTVILSPPRCGSTALALSLWQHRMFRYYLHEPYDRAFHDGSALSPETVLGSVCDRGTAPGGTPHGRGIVVKEMTFQAGEGVAELLAATTLPVVLLIRDPRLAVSSRMRRREVDGERPGFPAREAGWQDLAAIRAELASSKTDYAVVDISNVRRQPTCVLSAICHRLGLPWDGGMLSWQAHSGLRLGQLNGRQDRWYERVLSSTAFQPPEEPIPDPGYFRTREMLDIVKECLEYYQHARTDDRFIDVGEPLLGPTQAR